MELVNHTLLGSDLGLELALLDFQFFRIQSGQYLSLLYLVSFFHQFFRDPVAFPEGHRHFPDIHIPVKGQLPSGFFCLVLLVSIASQTASHSHHCHQGRQFLFVL